MHVSELELINFRSYKKKTVKFNEGINILLGPNGQGKTNIIEAIIYLSTLMSHRGSLNNALIYKDQESFYIRSKLFKNNNQIDLDVNFSSVRQFEARINRSSTRRGRDILGLCVAVIFSPEDLSLIKGNPEGRRNFLDVLITQLMPRYIQEKADYEKILKQRNALLKSVMYSQKITASVTNTLDLWDEQLATVGTRVIASRIKLIKKLLPYVDNFYSEVSAKQIPLKIMYKTNISNNYLNIDETLDSFDIKKLILEKIASIKNKEIERGISLVGPHLDDIIFVLNNLPVKGYASHGETWSFALSLRLASFKLLKENLNDDPILLLDDVFAELDDSRREQILSLINETEQVIITSAVRKDIPSILKANYIKLDNGEIYYDN